MAKISSYPSDGNVTTSDRLIGTDNENSNETKNFEVGDIINLASSIIGGNFVPYNGATNDVFLGGYEIQASGGSISDIYTDNIFPLSGSGFIFIGGGGAYGGVKIDTGNNIYKFGDFDTNVNGTSIQIFDSQQQIQFAGGFYVSNGEGTAGQILSSNGSGLTPSWITSPLTGYVPYTGAITDVDLDIYDLTANNIIGDIFSLNGEFRLNGSTGSSGQVLTSAGAGNTPTWASLPSLTGLVPYTGATGNVNLGLIGLVATSIFANNFCPIASGNTFFGGAGGYGTARNGVYALGTSTTILGNSSLFGNRTNIEIDDANDLIIVGNSASANIEIDSSGAANQIIINNTTFDIGGVDSLELANGEGAVFQVLTSQGFSAPQWSYTQDVIDFPFLSAHSDLTQTIVAPNVGQAMVINQPDTFNKITVNQNGSGALTRITFDDSGLYNIQFSAQLRRTTGGSSHTIDIWFRKGGTDIPNSNTSVNVQANAGFLVASWNFFYAIDVTQPNPFIEIIWAATDSSVILEAVAANAVHPATPSVIVTANKVSNVF